MTPWELAGKSEHSQQRALFCWANCAALYGFALSQYPATYLAATRNVLLRGSEHINPVPVPELKLLFAVHNQGHGDAIRGARAKAEGVKSGVPDVFLPVPRWRYYDVGGRELKAHGLFIELKLPGYAPSAVKPEQREWHEDLRKQGYRVEVCGGWEAAAKVIQDYMS